LKPTNPTTKDGHGYMKTKKYDKCPTCGDNGYDRNFADIFQCESCKKVYCHKCVKTRKNWLGNDTSRCPHCEAKVTFKIIGHIPPTYPKG